tara:strand:- start:1225 stop:1701 length:477 start_codon:yes stop_codon:yes gene_type:complete
MGNIVKLYMHEKSPSCDKNSFEKIDPEDIDLLAVTSYKLLNETHRYYQIEASPININSIIDKTKIELRHYILRLIVADILGLHSLSGQNGCQLEKINEDKIVSKSEKILIRFNLGEHSMIFWNDKCYVPFSQDLNLLFEDMISLDKVYNQFKFKANNE